MQGELKLFKQRHHVPDRLTECSWAYFAGFFDAEGSIVVLSTQTGLCLRLNQVNPSILVALLPFLHEQQLHGWKLYHRDSYSSVVCQNLRDCKQTLERLLENGLQVKRQQAKLALTLADENHLQLRNAISALNGWQSRYKRLDAAGIARAAEIGRLRARLHSQLQVERTSLQCQLDNLRGEHALQTCISRCLLLRKDIRQAMREGGQVTPPSRP